MLKSSSWVKWAMAAFVATAVTGAAAPASAAIQKTVFTFEQFRQLTGVPVARVKNGKTQYAQFVNRPTIKKDGFTIFVMKTGKVVIRVNTARLRGPTVVLTKFTLPGQNKAINISFKATPASTPGGSTGIDMGGFPIDPPPVSAS